MAEEALVATTAVTLHVNPTSTSFGLSNLRSSGRSQSSASGTSRPKGSISSAGATIFANENAANGTDADGDDLVNIPEVFVQEGQLDIRQLYEDAKTPGCPDNGRFIEEVSIGGMSRYRISSVPRTAELVVFQWWTIQSVASESKWKTKVVVQD